VRSAPPTGSPSTRRASWRPRGLDVYAVDLAGSPITTDPVPLTSVLAGVPGGLVLVACLGAVLLRRRARTALA
jgi:hypothetical protein